MEGESPTFGILVGERSLEPPPDLAATDLNRQVEDVLFKFIFTPPRNSFSVFDFLFSNLLLQTYSLVRQSEA